MFSLCCWFLTFENATEQIINKWISAERLSLRDILRSGDGREMLSQKIYQSALCQVISISHSSPLQSIPMCPWFYYKIRELISSYEQAINLEDPHLARNISLSIILGLSLSRLTLRTHCISELDLCFTEIFPQLSKMEVINLLQLFDIIWNELRESNLILVFNFFLIKLLHLMIPHVSIIHIFRVVAPSISFIEYPRFILLLDWLLENNILTLTHSNLRSIIHIQQSPEMLQQILNNLNIYEGTMNGILHNEELVYLAQVRDLFLTIFIVLLGDY